MTNWDYIKLEACTKREISEQIQQDIQKRFASADDMDHPLDKDIMNSLGELKAKLRENDDAFQIFRYREEVDNLWANLLEKAIKCLRYCDTREPFIQSGNSKRPIAYGIHTLREYYEKYTKFERVLYGATHYYRDHVVHVFRVWLEGVDLLTRNDCANLDNFIIHDAKAELSMVEKISMWTIIALTHDLGYPLEKARDILRSTCDMTATVLSNPEISADFSFHGVQNQTNDNIVRIMSSKMVPIRQGEGAEDAKSAEDAKGAKDAKDRESEKQTLYAARLQQKYYQKFLKSLESNRHGVLSAIIIAKILKYFLETDYSLNENYYFEQEDMRQFYIRREILRSIAAHTCDDIYLLYMGSFAFLLRICDDTQEWGRKYISELYTPSSETYELKDTSLNFHDAEKRCVITEKIDINKRGDAASLLSLVWRFHRQSLTYITVFRDGLDTQHRDFSFQRTQIIANSDVKIELSLDIQRENAAKLSGEVCCWTDTESANDPYRKELCQEIEKGAKKCKESQRFQFKYLDFNGNPLMEGELSKWRHFEFQLPLVNESGYL